MRIEKVSDNQIKCTLTREDLETRHIKLSELAYGTDKAKLLFRDMMQQAFSEFGFEAEDIPLMIEAIPVSRDSIVLIVTKVEDPEELDTRFSRFAPHLKDEMDEILGLSTIGLSERADEILDMFQKKVAEAEAAQEEDETASQISEGPTKAPARTGQNRKKTEELIRLFCFGNLDHVIDASHVLDTFFTGPSSLYKDPAEQTYYLRIKRGSTPLEDFNKSCNILSEYGTCIRQPYQTDEYLDEHFSCMINTDAIRKLAQV